MKKLKSIRRKVTGPIFRLLTSLACLLAMAASFASAYAAEPVKIGVLAYRPKPQTLAQWQPLAAALKQAMPERDFVVEALTHPELDLAVASRQLDFVVTNPGHYVLLTKRSGLSAPLATLSVSANERGQAISVFGGVIFSRAGQAKIDALTDLKGKTIATASTESLAGYQIQAYELSQVGIRLPQDAKLLITGMPHDNAVESVLAGRADVGFVRSGVLEGMVREGKLDMAQLKILNRQNLPGFPAQISTRLYPEWPVAALPHINEDLARHVAAALFLLEKDTTTTRAMNIHGFVVPADYTPVADMLRELRFPPFDAAPSFTLQDVGERYPWQIIAGLFSVGFILLMAFRLWVLNHRLSAEKHIVLLQRQQLQESEFRWKFALEGSGEGLWDWNMADNSMFFSKRWKEMLDYDEDEIGNGLEEWEKRIHPDDKAATLATVQAHLDGKIPVYASEHRVQCKDGSYKWILDRGMVVNRTKDGKPLRMIGTHADITERKQLEQEKEQFFRFFILSIDPMCIADPYGCFKQVNPAFVHMTGFSESELVARPFLEFILPEDRQRTADEMKQQVEIRPSLHFENRYVGKDGTIKLLSWTAFFDKNDGVTYATARDITEYRQAEEKLRILNETLELRVHEETAKNMAQERLLIQQSRLAAMGEMIHNIAHQWRQPINALTLLLANIKDSFEFNELTKESLDSEVQTGQRLIQGMSTTIDDFRNFFLPNKEKEFFLTGDSVEAAIKLVSDSFAVLNIKIIQEKSVEPCFVFGYPNEFSQVVLNVLTNAKEAIIGKNIAGEIHVKISNDENAVIVSIRDNGGGVPDRILDKIFDPYFTTKEGGSGIGLYMSKMIMNNMDGGITIRNIEGGAEVLLSLPVAKPAV
jgi:PAS domain S-box-containing protein